MVGLDPTTQHFRITINFDMILRINSQTIFVLLSLGGRVKPDHGEIIKEYGMKRRIT